MKTKYIPFILYFILNGCVLLYSQIYSKEQMQYLNSVMLKNEMKYHDSIDIIQRHIPFSKIVDNPNFTHLTTFDFTPYQKEGKYVLFITKDSTYQYLYDRIIHQ